MTGNSVNGALDGSAQNTDYKSDAIFASIAPALWCCNTVQDVYNGIHIKGNCKSGMGNLFSGNSFNGGHTNALHLESSGILGLQDHRGNQWFSSAINWQALNDGGAQNAPNSVFKVSNGTYKPATLSPATGWFVIIDVAEPNCNNNCGSTPDGHLDDLDQRIAANTFSLTNHQTGTLWSLQRQLYRRLSDHPDLVVAGSVFQGFVTSHGSALVGQLTDVERGMEAVYLVSAADQAR